MTAQGEDVLAWLEQAINEREETARRASHQKLWRTHDTHLDLGGHTATVLTGERNDTELLAWVPTMSHQPWDESRNAWNNAEHIALNDPASVLCRCAADRKILDLHSRIEDGTQLSVDFPQCKTCCEEGGYEREAETFPCLTLRLLAEGYGWTGGER
ncbi:hypothetical protein HZZ00_37735 (plasmid) [Streptomyces sp. NEAU-sy36]|uniref:DUF6221 family protein n=1 Tax=unclassified Streptomyces TaxID=2593676 RepID=UPI0015D5CE52|nr:MULTISPECIES: DUF6221 family protein [unclassified Streptomyces]QLJ06774.1 hypothetical protein HZZ00_37735 [Streptomyces sp. NEAU-sy36]